MSNLSTVWHVFEQNLGHLAHTAFAVAASVSPRVRADVQVSNDE